MATAAFTVRRILTYCYQLLGLGGRMEPIGYLIAGTVLAVAAISVVGFLFTKCLERALNDKKS